MFCFAWRGADWVEFGRVEEGVEEGGFAHV